MDTVPGLLVLALLQGPTPAGPPALQPLPAALTKTFSGLLARAPGFAGVTQRVLEADLSGVGPAPGAPFPVWVVEFHWTEGGRRRPGVALFVEVAGALRHDPRAETQLALRADGWALATVSEDQTFAAWVDAMSSARRAANEAAAVADLRTVSSAQETFKFISGGTYGELACLGQPSTCIAGSKEPPIANLAIAAAPERGGYRRTFHPGKRVAGKGKERHLESWAFTAVPLTPDAGRSAFCVDATGNVCESSDGTMAPIRDGTCPAACKPVP